MHAYSLLAAASAPSPFGPLAAIPPIVIAIIAAWTLVLKGFALWYAARGGQKWWYIALLIINTLGILEIVYLIWFRPRSFELETPGVDTSSPAA